MRVPRDLSGSDLIRALSALGYSVTRRSGSHVRLTTSERGQHHVTIPNHDALRLGTISAILARGNASAVGAIALRARLAPMGWGMGVGVAVAEIRAGKCCA